VIKCRPQWPHLTIEAKANVLVESGPVKQPVQKGFHLMVTATRIIPNFQANNLLLVSEIYAHFLPSLAIYAHCC
jgi:hypothetical protein